MCHTLDMSLGRADFFRLLPTAVGPYVVDSEGVIHGAEGGRAWTIQLVPLEPLRLGSVELPRQRVVMNLQGLRGEQAEAFLARFHRAFQRGGG